MEEGTGEQIYHLMPEAEQRAPGLWFKVGAGQYGFPSILITKC